MKTLNKLKLLVIVLISTISLSTANAQCTASFNIVHNGNGNYTFTSTSTGANLAAHFWNFGDGNNGWSSSTSHTFVNGTYNVCLLIDDSITCHDSICQTITVTSGQNANCHANFVIYPDSNTTNVIVVNYSTGNNLSYFWDFGDGNNSTLQYPNHTYTTTGPFNLCLIVSDGVNCADTICATINSGGIVLRQTGFTINVISPSSTGIEDEVKLISELSTYPNPIKGKLTIELDLLEQAQIDVSVVDLLGNTVAIISNEQMNSGTNKLYWNTSNIANGIYLLNVKTSNSLQVKKLVVNH